MMGKVMVEVAPSKVALPEGAIDTPREVRAAAVPPSRVTDVPTPDRLGMAVTVSAEPVVPVELDVLSLPHAAPARASAVKRMDAVAFVLIRTGSLSLSRRVQVVYGPTSPS